MSRKVLRSLLRANFAAFCEWGWPLVDPDPYQEAPFFSVMARYLEAFAAGKIRKLLINVPPGHSKSIRVSILFPAWVWTRRPSARFVGTSYAQELAYRDSGKCRDLVLSDQYQEMFPDAFPVGRGGGGTRLQRFTNLQKGYRFACAVSGIMGEGGDFIILDDPHNVKVAESDDVRNEVVRQLNLALPTRVRSKDGGIVTIMQRLHQKDFAASMLSEPETVHLCLPAEYEADHPHVCKPLTLPDGTVLPGDPRTEEGELLFPNLFDRERIDGLRITLGEYGVAGQLQQRPAPREGGMFKRAWLERTMKRAELPYDRIRVRGWDLASTEKPDSPWSVGVLLSYSRGRFIVEDVVRKRGTPGAIQRLIYETACRDGYGVHIDLPQDPGQAGVAQIQNYVRMLAGWTVYSSPESGSKIERANPVASQAEHGNLWILEAAWRRAFVRELAAFWTGTYADQVDALSRAFARLILLGETLTQGRVRGSW